MRATFKGHTDEVNSIAFSPDGRSLVSASDDFSVCTWNIRDGSSKKLPVTRGSSVFVSAVFSPNGRYIAAGDLSHSLWIWDSRTLKLVANWEDHSVWCVEFTPDGQGLMSGGTDKILKYWDMGSLEILVPASGQKLATPKHPFPLIRSFSGHTVCFYFPFLLHVVG